MKFVWNAGRFLAAGLFIQKASHATYSEMLIDMAMIEFMTTTDDIDPGGDIVVDNWGLADEP